MDIVLTGATGFVGSEVLAQLLVHREVHRITCVVRRNIGIQSPKIKTILHGDFTTYEPELATALANHSACIWALGGKASDNPNSTEYLRATHTFTIAFARAVAEQQKQPFRFCYLSGMGADPSETSTFPWERITRHLKGRTERDLEALTDQYPLFSATSFRPAGILRAVPSGAKHDFFPTLIDFLLAPISVRVSRLAEAMIREAVYTAPKYHVVSNREIRKLGNAW